MEQTLEVTDLDKGSGVFMIQTNPVKLIDHYENIIHIINMTQYEKAFKNLKHIAT